jgi:hypothetical protein
MKIAWLGHIASPRGNGIVTYSREMITGLRHRGQDVKFFYHISRERRGVERDPDGIRIGSFDILNRAMLSSPNARQLIEETIEREQIDVAHISLSFSQIDFSLPEICHAMGIPRTVHPTLFGAARFAGSIVFIPARSKITMPSLSFQRTKATC